MAKHIQHRSSCAHVKNNLCTLVINKSSPNGYLCVRSINGRPQKQAELGHNDKDNFAFDAEKHKNAMLVKRKHQQCASSIRLSSHSLYTPKSANTHQRTPPRTELHTHQPLQMLHENLQAHIVREDRLSSIRTWRRPVHRVRHVRRGRVEL
jgi:hypothetical protein